MRELLYDVNKKGRINLVYYIF